MRQNIMTMVNVRASVVSVHIVIHVQHMNNIRLNPIVSAVAKNAICAKRTGPRQDNDTFPRKS